MDQNPCQSIEIEYAIDPSGMIHPITPPRSDHFYEGHDLARCDGSPVPSGPQWDKLRELFKNTTVALNEPGRLPDMRGGHMPRGRGITAAPKPKCICGLWSVDPNRMSGHDSWCEIKG